MVVRVLYGLVGSFFLLAGLWLLVAWLGSLRHEVGTSVAEAHGRAREDRIHSWLWPLVAPGFIFFGLLTLVTAIGGEVLDRVAFAVERALLVYLGIMILIAVVVLWRFDFFRYLEDVTREVEEQKDSTDRDWRRLAKMLTIFELPSERVGSRIFGVLPSRIASRLVAAVLLIVLAAGVWWFWPRPRGAHPVLMLPSPLRAIVNGAQTVWRAVDWVDAAWEWTIAALLLAAILLASVMALVRRRWKEGFIILAVAVVLVLVVWGAHQFIQYLLDWGRQQYPR